MTIVELINASAEHLKSKGFNNPKTSCEVLLAHVLRMKRLDLYLNYDRPVSDTERKQFKELYKRRLNHEPLQYITGETEFMSLPFSVNQNVLIPRPETEFVVEQALNRMKKNWGGEPVKVLDIGSGCGNISVSLAHYLPNAEVFSIDKSPEAVEIAKKNAESNNIPDRLKISIKNIFDCSHDDYSDLNMVISNPPYVSENERDILEKDVIEFEPHDALFAGDDGLVFFNKISSLAYSWLIPGGILVFETGYNIGRKVAEITAAEGFGNIEFKKDYAENDRLIIAEKPEND